ncbi:unnamed protein product [Gadus morhua 'NCC']
MVSSLTPVHPQELSARDVELSGGGHFKPVKARWFLIISDPPDIHGRTMTRGLDSGSAAAPPPPSGDPEGLLLLPGRGSSQMGSHSGT